LNKNVSVVIPTIGEQSLMTTINLLNDGLLIPHEILIVIPNIFISNLNNITMPSNVTILDVNLASQVQQRIHGFIHAHNDYVLQLDSDILLEKDALYNLFNMLIDKGPNSCVAPIYKTDLNVKLNKIKSYLFKYFINRERKFNNWDTWYEFYIPKNSNFSQVKWLPGGCILHYKKNLITKNYYLLKGKAYDEDLLHSFLLTKNNINLYICSNAKAESVDFIHYNHKNFLSFIKFIYKISRVKFSLLIMSRGNKLFFAIWYSQWIINEIIRYIKNLFRSYK
tara:strand:- start:2191 stop:3030 length:840 start_codon:yes stop_codon:yes gene_type:complete